MAARYHDREPLAIDEPTHLAPSPPPHRGTAMLAALTPSFFLPAAPARDPRPTDWLDGLRGTCALMVLHTHLAQVLCRCLGTGYGLPDETPNLLRLPVVSLAYAGFVAVCIFFLISGYALSLAPVRRMQHPMPRDGGGGAAGVRLWASQVLRRPVRLLVPSWVSTALAFALIQLGLVAAALRVADESPVLDGRLEQYTVYGPLDLGFFAQLGDVVRENAKLLMLWDQPHANSKYNAALWTIPLELRSSLMLYCVYLVYGYIADQRLRVGLALALVPLTMHFNILDVPMFLVGYSLCELDSARQYFESKPRFATQALLVTLFCLGLWFASIPGQRADQTPGYRTLASINPLGQYSSVYFWQTLGSTFIFAPISHLAPLRNFFSLPFMKYLGKISFAVYLLHAPIVAVLGTALFHQAWTVTGTASIWMQLLGFVVAYPILLLAILCSADIFSRLVDDNAIILSKWVGKLIKPEKPDLERVLLT